MKPMARRRTSKMHTLKRKLTMVDTVTVRSNKYRYGLSEGQIAAIEIWGAIIAICLFLLACALILSTLYFFFLWASWWGLVATPLIAFIGLTIYVLKILPTGEENK